LTEAIRFEPADAFYKPFPMKFRAIRDGPFLEEAKIQKVPTREWPYSAAQIYYTEKLRAYVHEHRMEERFQSLRFSGVYPFVNGAAMALPYGADVPYLTYKDKRYWAFLKYVADYLYKRVDDVERKSVCLMLNNSAKRIHWGLRMNDTGDYVIPASLYNVRAMNVFAANFELFELKTLMTVPPTETTYGINKVSGFGDPNKTVFGEVIDPKSVRVGKDIYWQDPKDMVYLRKNLLDVKLAYWEDPLGYETSLPQIYEAMKCGVNPDNVIDLFRRSLITICHIGERNNNSDPCLDYDGNFDVDHAYHGKDRPYAYNKMRSTVTGEYSAQKYASLLRPVDNLPGCIHKTRFMYPANNWKEAPFTSLSTHALTILDRLSSAFPSDRPEVVNRWRVAAKKMVELGYEVYVWFGDRSNAEKTITTNYDLLLNAIPHFWRDYMRFSRFTVMPSDSGVMVVPTGMCSAVWNTTNTNLHIGTFEGAHCLYLWLKHNGYMPHGEEQFMDEFSSNILSQGDGVYHPTYAYLPCLGLDDVAGLVGIRGSRCEALPPAILSQLKMSFEVSQIGTITFGMHLTPTDMTVAQTARLAKIFKSEDLGFPYQDHFRAYVRITECGHKDFIDHALDRFFHTNSAGYTHGFRMYQNWLAEFGIAIGDVLGYHSPAEKLLYGKYVGEGAVTRSGKPSDRALEQVFAIHNRYLFGGSIGNFYKQREISRDALRKSTASDRRTFAS